MSVFSDIYRWLVCPHRLAVLRPRLRVPGCKLLDVGCGNHSPSTTKQRFPDCVYHGLYSERWNLDERDDQNMDRAFTMDLETPAHISELPEKDYDVIICSHVLEHVSEPSAVTAMLLRNLREGGCLYIETPAPRSMNLPRTGDGWMRIKGCLNFRDDETHKELVDLDALCDSLSGESVTVSRPRPARLWRKVILLPFYVVATLVMKGFVPASVFWDITGFAQYILVQDERGRREGV